MMSDALTIPAERLRACLRERYGLAVDIIERLSLGLDSSARVYRVVSATGLAYLVKARSAAFYEASCAAPRYLADQGIAAVVAPLPTLEGALWTRLDAVRDWVIAVYPYIAGISGWRPAMSDAQWRATGAIFRQIHDAPLPLAGSMALRRESFEPERYAHEVAEIEARHGEAESGTPTVQALREQSRSQWTAHRATIHALLAAMETLAPTLRLGAGPLVICHADLHPGNLLRDDAGGVFVVDWDDVMLAPKERDFLFVGDPRAGRKDAAVGTDGAGGADAASFYQGYQVETIDWLALTYYRCERIITDVIECARDVFFRGDTDDDVIADAAGLLNAVLAPGDGMAVGVRQAASQLPPGLILPDPFER